jgi:tetratricopeptide (TPR) repeat protein
MEQLLGDITKMLEGQEFSSIEEANAFLQEVMAAGVPVPTQEPSPLERAQELMYEAWEATGKRRLMLARQALEISEDCADAYVLLAGEAGSLHEARALYEQGVRAGERALGPETFEEDAGYFWGILETRPYMRARAGLAECLWQLGKRDEAIGHLQEMLRLNPNDNQGIRYLLVNRLLETGRDDEVGELLAQFEEDASAGWSYSRALWLFRREGASTKANSALEGAVKDNPHVPDFLLGKKKLPKTAPPFIGFGDESEAVDYALDALALWRRTNGALQWLEART